MRLRISLTIAVGAAKLCAVAAPAVADDINYTYDELGRLTVVEYPSAANPGYSDNITYTYDAVGNRVSVESDLLDRDGDGIPDDVDPSPNFDQREFGGLIKLLFED